MRFGFNTFKLVGYARQVRLTRYRNHSGNEVADIVTLGQAGTTESTIKRLKDDLEEAGDGLTGNDDFI